MPTPTPEQIAAAHKWACKRRAKREQLHGELLDTQEAAYRALRRGDTATARQYLAACKDIRHDLDLARSIA